jgi:hypothetical protein
MAWLADRRQDPTPINIDLFDHDAQLSIDSRFCYDIAESAVAFENFASR